MQMNMVKIFKEATPYLAPYAGKGKIFEHLLCTGARKSYGVRNLNHIFENQIDTDKLLARLIIMMEYLQDGYHSGQYAGPAGKYKYALTEYPEKYKLLVEGLSEQSLNVIRSVDVSTFCSAEPRNLGQLFCDSLKENRIKMEMSAHQQTHQIKKPSLNKTPVEINIAA